MGAAHSNSIGQAPRPQQLMLNTAHAIDEPVRGRTPLELGGGRELQKPPPPACRVQLRSAPTAPLCLETSAGQTVGGVVIRKSFAAELVIVSMSRCVGCHSSLLYGRKSDAVASELQMESANARSKACRATVETSLTL
jgi:hypothetical protein